MISSARWTEAMEAPLTSRPRLLPRERELLDHLSSNPPVFTTLESPSALSAKRNEMVLELDLGIGYEWFSGRGTIDDFSRLEVPFEELIAGYDRSGRNFDFYRGEESRFEPNARIGVAAIGADFFRAETEVKVALIDEPGKEVQDELSSGIRSWKGGAFVFEKALTSVGHGPLTLWYGRERTAWRLWPGRGLLLSGHALPSDGFGIDIDSDRFGFSSINLELRNVGSPKKLSAHQVRFAPLDWLLVSTAEAVVYEGGFLPAYVNPITIYYAVQHNERESDNILWHWEILARIRNGLVISAEILIDDYQYDKTGQNKIAFSPEIYVQSGRFELSGRYVHIEPGVYTHTDRHLDYVSGSDPLGFFLSQDSDFVSAQLTFHHQSWLCTWAEMLYLRRGPIDASAKSEGGGVEIGARVMSTGKLDFEVSGIIMEFGDQDYSAFFGELSVEFPGVF